MHRYYDHLSHVIGHRGACGHCPENTTSSLRKAKSLGCTWVEIDVCLTSDGLPVIFHDDTLNRCTNGEGLMLKCHSSTILELDAGGWFSPEYSGEKILTLEQVIHEIIALDVNLNLEIKSHLGWEPETVAAVARVLNEKWPSDKPLIISSFLPEILKEARIHLPQFPRGLNIDVIPTNWLERLSEIDAGSLHFYEPFADSAKIEALKRAGYKVMCFTVNNPNRAQELYEMGVDSVFCDYPERMITGQ